MRIGEVVGAVALVGVAVLVGIALTDDPTPETITADTSPFVFAASTSPAPSSTAATTPPPTTAAVATTVAPAAPTTAARPPRRHPPTTAAPTPALIPPEQRAGIAVRVLNGGAPALCSHEDVGGAAGRRVRPGRVGRRDAARGGDPASSSPPAASSTRRPSTISSRARPENVVPVPRRRPELGGVRRGPRRAGRARTGRNVTSSLLLRQTELWWSRSITSEY